MMMTLLLLLLPLLPLLQLMMMRMIMMMRARTICLQPPTRLRQRGRKMM